MMLQALFWTFLFILFYAYAGYALILMLLVKIKKGFAISGKNHEDTLYEPDVCLFVTAYNEKDYVQMKVENSFSLDYPKDKIHYVWVTDGSDDGTPDMLREYSELQVYHLPERRGKMHAMNRGMQFVTDSLVIFSDTNTLLSRNAIREMVALFRDPKVGCVAGEKRIAEKSTDAAAAAGEGLYWKYESWIKKMDAQLNSAVGAVGELFAIRRELFLEVEPDTILDDFIISLRIAQRGYTIAYAPEARAVETASLNVSEELKRKVRIAAGGVQALFRLKNLLNPFKYGLLSWQYFSHKVLRWTLAPIALFAILPLNFLLVVFSGPGPWQQFYIVFMLIQAAGYLLAIPGWILENRRIRCKLLFIPYYFIAIHFASLLGIIRYFKGKQSVKWEKSKRA